MIDFLHNKSSTSVAFPTVICFANANNNAPVLLCCNFIQPCVNDKTPISTAVSQALFLAGSHLLHHSWRTKVNDFYNRFAFLSPVPYAGVLIVKIHLQNICLHHIFENNSILPFLLQQLFYRPNLLDKQYPKRVLLLI